MDKQKYEFEFFAGDSFYSGNLFGVIVMIVCGIFALSFINNNSDRPSVYSSSSDTSSLDGVTFLFVAFMIVMVILMVRSSVNERSNPIPIIGGTEEDFVFRLDSAVALSLPWDQIAFIAYKKKIESDEDGSTTYHYICPKTVYDQEYEICINKLDENKDDIRQVIQQYHPEVKFLNF